MDKEIDRVIETIRKLTNMTISNGCSEGEAMNAAMRIGELLKVYNLTIDKVFLDATACVTGFFELEDRKRRHPIDGCVISVGDFCDCKAWFARHYENFEAKASYAFFGLPTDVEMAKYLLGIIAKAIGTETNRFKQSNLYTQASVHGKTLTTNFQRGFSSTVGNRLRKMTSLRYESNPTAVNGGGSQITDMVLVKRNKVEDEFEKLGVKLTKKKQSSIRHNGQAYDSGSFAGKNVNLNRPISSSGKQGLLT